MQPKNHDAHKWFKSQLNEQELENPTISDEASDHKKLIHKEYVGFETFYRCQLFQNMMTINQQASRDQRSYKFEADRQVLPTMFEVFVDVGIDIFNKSMLMSIMKFHWSPEDRVWHNVTNKAEAKICKQYALKRFVEMFIKATPAESLNSAEPHLFYTIEDLFQIKIDRQTYYDMKEGILNGS